MLVDRGLELKVAAKKRKRSIKGHGNDELKALDELVLALKEDSSEVSEAKEKLSATRIRTIEKLIHEKDDQKN